MITDLAYEVKTKLEEHTLKQSTINVELPDIKFPTFDGNFLKWPQFRENFIVLIRNNSALPHVNKIHYLRSSLLGEAKTFIRDIASDQCKLRDCMEFTVQLTPWLMEPGGSMPNSQGLSNNPHPELNQPNYSYC